MSKRNRGEFVKYRKDRGWWGVAEYVKGQLYWRVSELGSEEEAKVALAKRVLENGKRDSNDITLGEIMAYYLDHKAPTLADPQNAIDFDERLAGFWASKKLKDINQANIRAYHEYADKQFAEFQKGQKYENIRSIKPSSVRRHLEHLRACVGLAYRSEIIDRFPHFELPEKGENKERWLTRKEAAKLLREARKLKYARTYLPHFIRIALRTGARKEKVLSSRGNQIDLQNQCFGYSGGNKIKRTGKAPIFDSQVPYFRAMKNKYGIGYLVNMYGKPVKNVQGSFDTACKNAGLENVTIHTLRHTFASWLKQEGASDADIAEALGNSAIMVANTYAHMGDGYIRKLNKVGR